MGRRGGVAICDMAASAELVHDLDLADDVRVELVQLLGGHPQLENRPPTGLLNGYRSRNSDSTSNRVTNPAPSCRTFQSRAIRTA